MALNFPNSPSLNDTHTHNGLTWVWNGSVWEMQGSGGASVTVSDNAPSSPTHGDMWWESDTGDLKIYYDESETGAGSGAFWVSANGADSMVGISTSAPTNPQTGDLWWDSDVAALYMYYNDGNSSQWVSAASGATGAQGSVGDAGVAGAQGAQGAQGAAGATGAQGATGSTGAQGATGSTGAQGATGSTGSQGATGSTGSQGSTGPVAGSSTQVVYKDGSNNPAGSSSFTFDGTNLTVGGNLNVGGVLTYEDVTNIDSIGIITARAGVKVPDNQKIFLGTGNDLEIYHSGSHSYIKDVGQGNFYFATNRFEMRNAADNESIANFIQDGAVELYYDNSKKLETKSDGVDITGELQCDSLDVDGAADITGRVMTGGVFVGDGGDNDTSVSMGANNDLRLYHDGSNSYIKERGTGSLIVETTGGNIDLKHGSEYLARFKNDAEVELYHDNSKKFATATDGATMFGNLGFRDNDQIAMGQSSDLRIYHNGSHSYIADEGSGELIISGSRIQLMNAARGEKAIDFVQNGAVDIYYNGSRKFQTKSDGVDITGELLSDSLKVYSGNTGTVDIADFYTSNSGSGGSHCRLKVRTYPNAGGDPFIFFDGGGTNFVVGEQWNGTTNNILRLGAGNDMNTVAGMFITASGHCCPDANNQRDLGSNSNRWRDIYTMDLQLSNEARKDTGGNDVDGTWGDWTLQEGEDDIFMINNRNGKKFRIKMEEV